MAKTKKQNAVANFSARWSCPLDVKLVNPSPLNWLPVHPRYERVSCSKESALLLQPLLHKTLSGLADKFMYQLEDSFLIKTDEELYEAYNKGQTSYYHYQIGLHAQTKCRTGTLANQLSDGPFKNMQFQVCSTAGTHALRKYVMKDLTKVAGPWADHKIYRGADILPPSKFTPSQARLERYLLTSPDGRSIIWVFDPYGWAGKSAYAKSASYRHGWPVFSYSKASDILYLVSKFQNQPVYMFNLSKTKPADLSATELYAALESIKDGMFTSTKYECLNVLMGLCHIVVFANHLPDKSFMTGDRIKTVYWKQIPKKLRKRKAFDWGEDDLPWEEMEKHYDAANGRWTLDGVRIDTNADNLGLPKPKPKKKRKPNAWPL